MKKLAGNLLILLGILVILFSIIVLVKAFDLFTTMDSGIESIGYTIGNIIFPLLITVLGRWMFRKGKELTRSKLNSEEK
jgi:hypothetical protein